MAAVASVAVLTHLATPAHASSPKAWADYGQQVQRACVAASGLRQARPAGDRVDFTAAGGALTSALLLQGSYPQPHMAGRRGLELCLYEASTKQARVADADRLKFSARP
jgi:hypothetical protein